MSNSDIILFFILGVLTVIGVSNFFFMLRICELLGGSAIR